MQTIQLGLGRSRRLGLASFLACLPPVLRRIMNYWLGLSLIDLLELGIATSEVVDAGVRRGAGRRSVQFPLLVAAESSTEHEQGPDQCAAPACRTNTGAGERASSTAPAPLAARYSFREGDGG